MRGTKNTRLGAGRAADFQHLLAEVDGPRSIVTFAVIARVSQRIFWASVSEDLSTIAN